MTDDTQQELDDFTETTNRPALLILIRDLSEASGELPSTFWLSGVKRSTRRAYGGDAEIWVGSHAGQEVAIRDFWFPSEMSPDRLQKVCTDTPQRAIGCQLRRFQSLTDPVPPSSPCRSFGERSWRIAS